MFDAILSFLYNKCANPKKFPSFFRISNLKFFKKKSNFSLPPIDTMSLINIGVQLIDFPQGNSTVAFLDSMGNQVGSIDFSSSLLPGCGLTLFCVNTTIPSNTATFTVTTVLDGPGGLVMGQGTIPVALTNFTTLAITAVSITNSTYTLTVAVQSGMCSPTMRIGLQLQGQFQPSAACVSFSNASGVNVANFSSQIPSQNMEPVCTNVDLPSDARSFTVSTATITGSGNVPTNLVANQTLVINATGVSQGMYTLTTSIIPSLCIPPSPPPPPPPSRPTINVKIIIIKDGKKCDRHCHRQTKKCLCE
jgi:hypothetical protein